jgi:putative membrane protein
MIDTVPARRLHPFSWVFHAFQALREVALLLIVLLAPMLRSDLVLLPIAVALCALSALVAWGVVRARIVRYEILGEELLVREGLFVRETRHVPFTRIQAVNERQGPLHRLLGVTELVLESGSAGKPEAVMRVLGNAEAAHLTALLRRASALVQEDAATSAGAPPRQVPARELLKIPTDELVLHGILSNRGWIVVALLTGFISQNADLLDFLPIGDLLEKSDLDRWTRDGADTAMQLSLGTLLGALLVLLLGVVVLLRMLSVLHSVFTLYGFTLQRNADRLRVNRGLLVRVDVSGRVSGIQRIVLEQSLLHRAFRRYAVKADLAGASMIGNPEATHSRLDTLAPIATPATARSLLGELIPGIDLADLTWQPLHHSAAVRRWQRTLWWLVPTLGALVAAAWRLPVLPPAAPAVALALSAAALLASAWHARTWARWSAFAVTDGVVAFRDGAWSRSWTLLFDDRAQSTARRRSPRDRREGTASLTVDVQSMTLDHALRIPYLDVTDAERLNARFWRAGNSAPLPADAHAGGGLR